MCGLTRRADLILAETRDEELVLTCVLGKNFDYQLPGGGSSKVQEIIACKADEVAVRADGSLKSWRLRRIRTCVFNALRLACMVLLGIRYVSSST
jgi:hypothetical protein